MPNYLKTQIYKIVCNDPNIDSFYIGSTTNWTRRKQSHKNRCNDVNDKKNNLQIYQIMRENGGFENFNMILVEDYPCANKRESEKREQYWKDTLKPNMNKINAFSMEITDKNNPEYFKERYQKYKEKYPNLGKEKYTCKYCNIELSSSHKARHEKTKNHINNSLKESET
jgi:hypothetical protein